MSKKFICGFLEYDDDTQSKIMKMYALLKENGFQGQQTPNVPYHITVAYYNTNMEDKLKERYKKISSTYSQFEVNISHLGIFDMKVLFLGPDVNHQMLKLKDLMCEGSLGEEKGWSSHTTLLIDSKEKIMEAIPIIGQDFKNMKTKVSYISLYEFFPVRQIARYKLL